MRLWHESLIPNLPSQQLNGLHREIAGMRGDGWGQDHSTVNYVWQYQRFDLYRFHSIVLDERDRRDYGYDERFRNPTFLNGTKGYISDEKLLYSGQSAGCDNPIYPEHNSDYLQVCVENLEAKGHKIREKIA